MCLQGMVDPGEKISATLKREFGEEALNSLQKSSAEKREIEEKLHALFSQEHLVVRSSPGRPSQEGPWDLHTKHIC